MNKELLLDIFKIGAPSGKEEKMRVYIEKYFKANNIPFIKDEVGNLYNISYDNKPMLSSHMDTVQSETDSSLAKFIKIRGDVLSGYGIIGGDDKCGIYIILEALKAKKEINFLLSVGEEVGGKGVKHFTKFHPKLDNVTYCLVLDRRGNGDVICANNFYGTDEFENALLKVGERFKYKTSTGTFSDADFLNDCISCANLSVGYYNPHSRNEFVKISDLEKAGNYVNEILDTVKGRFVKPEYTYGKKKWWDYGFKYESEYACDDYGVLEEEACFICSTYSTSKLIYLRSLNKRVCKSCAADLVSDLKDVDLLQELEDEFFYDELEKYD
jgi:tripeptide aminopeptidase